MDTKVIKIRPIKLIAVIFTGITLLLLIVAVAEQEWVEVKFHEDDHRSRWGLWTRCMKENCNSLDFEWIKVSAAFVLISLLLTIAGIICGVLGLKVTAQCNNRLWYLSAGVIMACVALSDVLALIIYPVKFKDEIIIYEDVRRWDFDWTYGFGWGAFIFSAAAAIFFFIPTESKEVYRKPYSTDA